MAVILACPAGHRLKVPRKFMGQRIVCPVCDARIDVPASEHQQPTKATLPPEPVDAELFDFSEFVINEAEIRPALEVQQSLTQGRFVHTMLLSIASVAVALLCLAPSFVEQTMTRQLGVRSPDVWSYIVMLVAIIQIGMAVFAARVPDWSTVWLLTITATGVSAFYAAGLALTMFASQNHLFVRRLGLLDEAVRYRVQPWCFFVLCLGLMLAYFCGRCSVAWHQLEMQRGHSS